MLLSNVYSFPDGVVLPAHQQPFGESFDLRGLKGVTLKDGVATFSPGSSGVTISLTQIRSSERQGIVLKTPDPTDPLLLISNRNVRDESSLDRGVLIQPLGIYEFALRALREKQLLEPLGGSDLLFTDISSSKCENFGLIALEEKTRFLQDTLSKNEMLVRIRDTLSGVTIDSENIRHIFYFCDDRLIHIFGEGLLQDRELAWLVRLKEAVSAQTGLALPSRKGQGDSRVEGIPLVFRAFDATYIVEAIDRLGLDMV